MQGEQLGDIFGYQDFRFLQAMRSRGKANVESVVLSGQ